MFACRKGPGEDVGILVIVSDNQPNHRSLSLRTIPSGERKRSWRDRSPSPEFREFVADLPSSFQFRLGRNVLLGQRNCFLGDGLRVGLNPIAKSLVQIVSEHGDRKLQLKVLAYREAIPGLLS